MKLLKATNDTEEKEILSKSERRLRAFFFRNRVNLTLPEQFFQFYFLEDLTFQEFLEEWQIGLKEEFLGIVRLEEDYEGAVKKIMVTVIPRYRYMLDQHEKGNCALYDEEEARSLALAVEQATLAGIYQDLNSPNPKIKAIAQSDALKAMRFARPVNAREEEVNYVIS